MMDRRDAVAFSEAPYTVGDLSDLDNFDQILIIGGHIPHDQPVMSIRLRQAVEKGAKITCLRADQQSLPYPVSKDMICTIDQWQQQLLMWSQRGGPLQKSRSTLIISCLDVYYHPEGALVRQVMHAYADRVGARVWMLTDGPNTVGQWVAGMIPHMGPGFTQLDKPKLGMHQMKDPDMI